MPQIDWPTIAAMCAVLLSGGGIALVVLKSQLAHFFVTRPEHVDMDNRITSVERRLAMLPSHADFQALSAQLATLSGNVQASTARMEGVQSSVGRVEKQLDMLVQAQLERERSGNS